MHKEQFYDHLEVILRFIKEIKQINKAETFLETSTEREQLTYQFMRRYFQLYLLLRNNPNLKLDTMYKDFIVKSEDILGYLTSELNRYIWELEDRAGSIFYSNEWEGIICPRRSAIEAVKEMYRGTSFERVYEGDDPEILDLDTEELDELIEMKGEKEGYLKENQIPREIPASHWWWWSPNEPPDYVREDDE